MGSKKGQPKRIRHHKFDVDLAKDQVANHLKAIWVDTGMTKSAFAEELGTNASTLDNWLRGASWPQGDGVIALAHMGYEPNYLFLGIGPMKRQAAKRRMETEQEPQKLAAK